jgi:integrase
VCEFVIHGKRIQESTGSTSKTVAKEFEKRRRAELERAAEGLPTEPKGRRIRTVQEVTKAYLEGYGTTHRANSAVWIGCCFAHIDKALGTVLLSDLTEDRIRVYIRQRQSEGAAPRTINMELANLSRAMGHTWRELWPRLKKLEERKDIGRAVSLVEQERLFKALESDRTPHLRVLIPLLLLTGLRAGEAFSLTWGQVDLMAGTITVGRAKTSSGTGRVIPINAELARAIGTHRAAFIERFGALRPAHYLFAWGAPWPSDPARHITGVKHAWESLRKAAEVSCRMHDLRHTFATGLAEGGLRNQRCSQSWGT